MNQRPVSELVVADAEEHRVLRAHYNGAPVHYVAWSSDDDPDYDFQCVRANDAPPPGGFSKATAHCRKRDRWSS